MSVGVFVNIDVPDLERAIDFYGRALDLRVTRRLGRDVAELGGAEAPIYLVRHETGSPPFDGAAASRSWGRHWTPVHLDFVVDALEPALERATAAGAVVEGGVRSADWGRHAVCADPFGNGFCILELGARGYAALADA